MRFSSFVDKKKSQARRELEVIRDILGEGEMKVEDFINDENPHLFLKNSLDGLDFDGVRIYKVGSSLAYRIQKESDTQPYGQAYSLNVEDVFEDMVSDMSEEDAAKKVKKAILEEFKNFFRKSVEAQENLNSGGMDPQSKIIVNGTAGDLSNSM